MEEYKTKCVVIGRKKRKDNTKELYPCFVALFDKNNPQESGKAPEKVLDYDNMVGVRIKGCDIDYLLAGNDLIINNLKSVQISIKDNFLYIKGKQKSD